MTIDEAIKHCEEVAEKNEKQAKECHDNQVRKCEVISFAEMDYTRENECLECAKEHRQLAEWLRELKAYRESRKEITRKMNSGQWSEGVVYGLDKAVRIMEKHLREVNADE